jgi:hypothetical protein
MWFAIAFELQDLVPCLCNTQGGLKGGPPRRFDGPLARSLGPKCVSHITPALFGAQLRLS